MERFFKSLSFLSLIFLVFLAGNVYSLYDTRFIDWFGDTIKYFEAVSKQDELIKEYTESIPSRSLDNAGFKTSGRLEQGELTLFTTSSSEAYLLDDKANIIHKWTLKYEDAGLNTFAEVYHNKNFGAVYWRYFKLFSNGDMLVNFSNPASTPYGGGLIKIDKDSNLIWKYEGHAHHAFDINPKNGDIAAVTQKIGLEEFNKEYKNTPFLDDAITILTSEGKPIKEISIIKLFQNSGLEKFLELNIGNKQDDFIHLNSIKYVTKEQSEKLPFAEEGDFLASARELNLIFIIDKNMEKIKWYKQNVWQKQHDPQITAEGNIAIFDNKGMGGYRSRILEYNPNTDKIDWYYFGDNKEKFYAPIFGAIDITKNGNYLITESESNKIFEVTKDKKIVWSVKYEGSNFTRIFDAERYYRIELDFLNE